MRLILCFIYGENMILLGLAILLFTRGQKRKPGFRWRILLSSAINAACVLLCAEIYLSAERFSQVPWLHHGLAALPYVMILFTEMLGIRLCTEASRGTAAFSALAGYSVKQFSECLLYLLSLIPSFPTLELARQGGRFSHLAAYYGIKWAICGVVYAAVYLFLLRKNREKWLYSVNTKPSVYVLGFSSFLICNLFNVLQGSFTRTLSAYLICVVYNMLCCLQLLFIRIGVFEQDSLSRQMDVMRRVWMEKEAQTQLFRDNIEMINIKYHDLRRSVALLRGQQTDASAEILSGVEQALDTYEAEYDTGHPILDTVLTQYHLQCEKRRIRFSCMVDGNSLRFMSDANLVALFGNILENAVEASMELPEEERFITLSVRSNGSVVSVHEENATAHTLQMKDNLPVSSKADSDYHGYGMKSIRTIAEMYHGTVSVAAEGQAFILNILMIPSRMKESD